MQHPRRRTRHRWRRWRPEKRSSQLMTPPWSRSRSDCAGNRTGSTAAARAGSGRPWRRRGPAGRAVITSRASGGHPWPPSPPGSRRKLMPSSEIGIGASFTTAGTPRRLSWPMRSSRRVTGASRTLPLAVAARTGEAQLARRVADPSQRPRATARCRTRRCRPGSHLHAVDHARATELPAATLDGDAVPAVLPPYASR